MPNEGSALGVQRNNGAICAYVDAAWRSSATDRVGNGQWSFIVLRYAIGSSGTVESSLNGQHFELLFTGDTQDANNGSSSPYRIGGWSGGLSYFFEGKLDELRVASTARSASWIAAEHENQRVQSTFLSISD
jgi:hypothetical protein